MIRFPEKLRVTASKTPAANTLPGERWGFFIIPVSQRRMLVVVATAADAEGSEGWDHVSVRVEKRGGISQSRTPTWEEMCLVKDLFWEEEDCVVQFHPPRSQYVNNVDALHLWRHVDQAFPQPPTHLVGFVE